MQPATAQPAVPEQKSAAESPCPLLGSTSPWGGAPACPWLGQTTLPAPQRCTQVQDMATLRAELAQAQQEKARQEEKIAAYEEERHQLRWELRKLQGSQEQNKQEVSMSQAFPQGAGSLCSACLSLPLRATGRPTPSRRGCRR